jgi:glucosylceramidase
MTKSTPTIASIAFLALTCGVVPAQTNSPNRLEAWVTNPDRSALFQKLPEPVAFGAGNNARGSLIVIDPAQQMQSMEGFGFALTGGSAELLVKMSADARAKILKQIFARDASNLGVSYLRLSIGASDMNSFVFSYDDLAPGETDPDLQKFDLAQDRKDVIPVMKEILRISPDIKILSSWSFSATIFIRPSPKPA